jgi:hypothetical protein
MVVAVLAKSASSGSGLQDVLQQQLDMSCRWWRVLIRIMRMIRMEAWSIIALTACKTIDAVWAAESPGAWLCHSLETCCFQVKS